MLCRPNQQSQPEQEARYDESELPSLPGPALLFCPADRPDRYAKAAGRRRRGHPRPGGRRRRRRQGRGPGRAGRHATLDPARVIVRVNATGTAEHAADLAALRGTGYRTVMLPKTEIRAQLNALGDGWRRRRAVRDAARHRQRGRDRRAPNVIAVMWGAEDLVAVAGRPDQPVSRRALPGRRRARPVGRPARGRRARQAAIDAVYLDIRDLDGLAAEANDAAASGFALKACIHPSQVAVVRAAYRADEAQVAWAGGCWRRRATRGAATRARSRSTAR